MERETRARFPNADSGHCRASMEVRKSLTLHLELAACCSCKFTFRSTTERIGRSLRPTRPCKRCHNHGDHPTRKDNVVECHLGVGPAVGRSQSGPHKLLQLVKSPAWSTRRARCPSSTFMYLKRFSKSHQSASTGGGSSTDRLFGSSAASLYPSRRGGSSTSM